MTIDQLDDAIEAYRLAIIAEKEADARHSKAVTEQREATDALRDATAVMRDARLKVDALVEKAARD